MKEMALRFQQFVLWTESSFSDAMVMGGGHAYHDGVTESEFA